MKLVDWKSATPATRRAALSRPAAASRDDVFRQAADIVATVRAEGDAAVRRYNAKFGGASLDSLRVSAAEFADARAALRPDQVAALERAVANVARLTVVFGSNLGPGKATNCPPPRLRISAGNASNNPLSIASWT